MNAAPLEAGWKDRLAVEIANPANLLLCVYLNEGIGQILFFNPSKTAPSPNGSAAENIEVRTV